MRRGPVHRHNCAYQTVTQDTVRFSLRQVASVDLRTKLGCRPTWFPEYTVYSCTILWYGSTRTLEHSLSTNICCLSFQTNARDQGSRWRRPEAHSTIRPRLNRKDQSRQGRRVVVGVTIMQSLPNSRRHLKLTEGACVGAIDRRFLRERCPVALTRITD